MSDVRSDFQRRADVLNGLTARELQHRLAGLINWMLEEPTIGGLIANLKSQVNVNDLLSKRPAHPHAPPPANSLEEIAAIGLFVMEKCKEGGSLEAIMYNHGIGGGSGNLDEMAGDVLYKYVNPFLGYIRDALPEAYITLDDVESPLEPPIIKESLEKFRIEYPSPKKVGFLMMKFGTTPAHTAITQTVRETLDRFGLKVLRADEREYHEDLFPNVQTYMHGCGFGIAVLERIEAEEFNPNVSLEIGYMMAHRKPVLLLKDSTLRQLHADLVGKLYRPFDFQKPQDTIPPQLKSWLEDKGII